MEVATQVEVEATVEAGEEDVKTIGRRWQYSGEAFGIVTWFLGRYGTGGIVCGVAFLTL